MSDLYLILHKVRGEPAFDIGQHLDIGAEQHWIIPTSGHRAYPVRWWNLDDLYDGSDCDMRQPISYLDDDPAVILGDVQDHYQRKPDLVAVNLAQVEPDDLHEILKDLLGA